MTRNAVTPALALAVATSLTIVQAVRAEGAAFRLEAGQSIATGLSKSAGVFALRALGCQDLRSVRPSGTAETVIDGNRRTTPLKMTAAETPGVFAVGSTTSDRTFLAHVTATCPATGKTATALVSIQGYRLTRDASVFLDRAATSNEVHLALNRTMSAAPIQAAATPAR
jgi:hypothetical protein